MSRYQPRDIITDGVYVYPVVRVDPNSYDLIDHYGTEFTITQNQAHLNHALVGHLNAANATKQTASPAVNAEDAENATGGKKRRKSRGRKSRGRKSRRRKSRGRKSKK